MEFHFTELFENTYSIQTPEKIPTPRLVVFREKFEKNTEKMRQLLRSVSPDCGLELLWPHVKTHKSIWVAQKLMQAGISGFKSTPNEFEMLVQAGAVTIFVAYPLLPANARDITAVLEKNQHLEVFVQASQPVHIEYLLNAVKDKNIQWRYFIDLDVGLHRTGIPAQSALAFYRSIPETDQLQFAGLHAYDGHNNSRDPKIRLEESQRISRLLTETIACFEGAGISVPRLVVGGTPGFLSDLECLACAGLNTQLILSPGTWVYFDTNNNKIAPGRFDPAALILVQVMDKVGEGTATLNLGHKRWSIDRGPVEGFSVNGMKTLRWSEEHTVVSIPPEAQVGIGDYILIAPRHICSTVNLWEEMTIVGSDGHIEELASPIQGRNR